MECRVIDAVRAAKVVWVECSKVQEHEGKIKNVSVSLRRERTKGRTLQGDDVRRSSGTVRLNIEKAMVIGRFSRLKSFVGDR